MSPLSNGWGIRYTSTKTRLRLARSHRTRFNGADELTPWELKTPDNWPTEPSAKALRLNLPIQLVPLPTYASWTNPQEKVWRHLQQEELHLHRLADRWEDLKQVIRDHLDQFKDGSQELLRYIGLTPNSKLYGAYLVPNSPGTG